MPDRHNQLEAPRQNRIHQVFKRADFADGGGAAGTAPFATQIPLYAVVFQTLVRLNKKFIGDTSAALIVGDGTDTDRYLTGTVDLFTALGQLDAGTPSGTKPHSAAKTPILTVTSASDFTLVTDGEVEVTIWYYE